jgi:two-component system, cell cycle response regulator
MLLSRDELIAALFRETDRAQRMKTGLAVILCGIDDWENRASRFDDRTLGEVEREITKRIVRLLRCYDSIGRYGGGEFLVVLPGCNSFNAVGMAERLSCEVFGAPVRGGNEDWHFTACFGIAGSGGRSPIVVLRNADQALRNARMRGRGSIERSSYDAEPDPSTLLTPVIEHEALHW